MNLAKPERPLEVAICAGEVTPSNRKLWSAATCRRCRSYRRNSVTSMISARHAIAGPRRAVKQLRVPAGLFADENKDASGQCYDVEKKDGRPEIQAET